MKRSINLLPERSHKRNQVRRCLRIWSRLYVLLLVLLASIGGVHWYACKQVHRQQVSVEAEYEPVRQLKLENARLRKEIASLERAEIIPLKLAEHRPLLALVGLTNEAMSTQQQRLYLKQLEIDRAPHILDTPEQGPLSVVLDGVATDQDAAQQLADYLRRLGPFSAVDLTTSDLPANTQQRQLAFSIECTNQ